MKTIGSLLSAVVPFGSSPAAAPVALALGWLGRHELADGGIRVHDTHGRAYPEVTGYLVPTMLDYREEALARRCLEWLLRTQAADGSYRDPDGGAPFIFDTGQVLRGLLAGAELVPAARTAADPAAGWLVGQMIDEGRGGFPAAYEAFHYCPESVQLYVLPALRQAAQVLGKPRYAEAADRCLGYYLGQACLLDLDRTLTHFLAYELEALIDLGRGELALPVLETLAGLQRPDGSVRGIGGVDWVCTPGLLQIAICWYKTGRGEAADRALAWVESHQRKSGGFLGSYGRKSWYFPRNELSWATKYYLDANLMRRRATLAGGEEDGAGRVGAPREGVADRLSAEKWHDVLVHPGTLDAVVSRVQRGEMSDWCRYLVAATAPGESVLEIASGTGEISLVLASLGRSVTLVDLSTESLAFSRRCAERLGLAIKTVEADVLERFPFDDDSFDCVWSSGLLEHFSPPERVTILREKGRVSRGRVVSLVPNAACLAYRAGKADQEARGVWPYGLETPIQTQREDFAAAGLAVTGESTVGASHALAFLRRGHPLHRALNKWLAERPEDELLDCWQGYLLATVGEKGDNGRRARMPIDA